MAEYTNMSKAECYKLIAEKKEEIAKIEAAAQKEEESARSAVESEHNAEIDSLQPQLTKAIAVQDDAIKQFNEWKTKMDDLKAKVNNLTKELNNKKKERNTAIIQSVKEIESKAKADKSLILKEIKAIEKRLKIIEKEEKAELEIKEIKEVKEEIKEAKEEIKEAKIEIKEAKEEIKEAKKEIAEIKEIEEVKEEIKEATEKIKQAKEKIAEIKEIKEVKEKITEKMDIKALKEELQKEIEEKKEIEIEVEDTISEELEFFNPDVPPPRKIQPIPEDTSQLPQEILEKINQINSEDTQAILLNCERCNDKIIIPVPKKAVLEIKNPEVLITYVHRNKDNENQHCIIFEVDHNFKVQLPKSGDVVILDQESSDNDEMYNITNVLIGCKRCNDNILVPIPDKIITNSKIYNSPIAYIHNNLEDKDQHGLIIYIDQHSGVRGQRISDLIIF